MGASKSKCKRILIAGIENVGKTSLVQRIIERPACTSLHTQGLRINFCEKQGIHLCLWELPGLSMFRSRWPGYFHDVDIIVFVTDSSNVKRLEESNILLRTMLNSPFLAGVPLLVFNNKSDRLIRKTVKQTTKIMQLKMLRDRHWYIQDSSAETGFGIDLGLEWILNELRMANSTGARQLTTAALPKRHMAILAELIKNNEPKILKLHTLQLQFEKTTGVFYGAHSIITALEDLGLAWKKRYPSPYEDQIQRLILQYKVSNPLFSQKVKETHRQDKENVMARKIDRLENKRMSMKEEIRTSSEAKKRYDRLLSKIKWYKEDYKLLTGREYGAKDVEKGKGDRNDEGAGDEDTQTNTTLVETDEAIEDIIADEDAELEPLL